MPTRAFNPASMPPPGPYSHIVSIPLGDADLVMVSGQIGTDAAGNLVGDGDIVAQAVQAMENIRIAVEAAGGGLPDIVKLTTYVTNLSGRADIRALRARLFPTDPPASTSVVVAGLFDPAALIEIDAIAFIPAKATA